MRELGTLGFSLLGMYVVLAPIPQLGWAITSIGQRDSVDLQGLAIAAGFWAVSALAPGAALVIYARRLSSWVLQDPGSDPEVEHLLQPHHVYRAAVAVLGFWLCIGGISAFLSTVLGLIFTLFSMSADLLNQPAWYSSYATVLSGAVLRTAAGVFLILRPHVVVAFIQREHPKPSA